MTAKPAINLLDYIREIPDFPKPGVRFRDVTPLLANGDAFGAAVSQMGCFISSDVDAIVGIESRGFIFGAALAVQMDLGFVPVRKPGKLPAAVHAVEYELEYGVDMLEIHRDALAPGHRVAVVDDLLATGGTASSAVELVRALGAEVSECVFLIELDGLHGRQKLVDVPVHSVVHYEG